MVSQTPGDTEMRSLSCREVYCNAAQVSDSFPFEWIKKKWREGFHVTAMATAGPQWAVVMSRNAGFQAQCVELDFQYSSEGIHRRWDEGARPL